MTTPAASDPGDVGNQHAANGALGIAFCPNMGAVDFLDLFRHPEVWADLRRRLSAVKMYAQAFLDPAWPGVGPNTYRALADVGAFRSLRDWGLSLHLEQGAVKEWEVAERMGQELREPTRRAVERVREAGGEIAVLCMDEPLASTVVGAGGEGPGRLPVDRVGDVARYTAEFAHALLPIVPAVALLEAYPHHPADRLAAFLRLVAADNGVPLAFFEIDMDLFAIANQRLSDDRVRGDLQRLKSSCEELGVPFRAVVTGTHARSAAEFRDESLRLARKIGDLARPLAGVTVQSWVEHEGQNTIPATLPLADQTSHLAVLKDVLDLNLMEPAGSDRRGGGIAGWLRRVLTGE